MNELRTTVRIWGREEKRKENIWAGKNEGCFRFILDNIDDVPLDEKVVEVDIDSLIMMAMIQNTRVSR